MIRIGQTVKAAPLHFEIIGFHNGQLFFYCVKQEKIHLVGYTGKVESPPSIFKEEIDGQLIIF